MINGAIGEMVWVAEQYSSRDRHADVAIDIIYVAYYGDRDECQMSPGAAPSKSYSWCDKIASDHVSLGTVSADAEFDGIGVINALEEKRLS